MRVQAHEEHRIRYLMLANSASENDHASFWRFHAEIVDLPDVGDNVNQQRCCRLVRMEEKHVAQRAIRQSWAKDGNVVLRVASAGD